MPNGRVISHCMPESTPFSIQEKMGPKIVSVRYPVTRTVTRGVTNRSMISGTILCSRFSSMLMNHTAITTGITCPWYPVRLISYRPNHTSAVGMLSAEATLQAFIRSGWIMIMPITAPRNWLPPNTFAALTATRMGRKVNAALENRWMMV